jgi:uncharacterized circularly permuted ATP-grasp superfamily protein/uncharacterized alpha-E superfamily protein
MKEFLAQYEVDPDGVDEMKETDGLLKPHWQSFAREFEKISPKALQLLQGELNRKLHENGVTYNVHGAVQDDGRSWELDPIPLIISGDEWQSVEQGLCQRAELLNQVLGDVYGSRELVAEGLVPHELIFEHEGFLRPMDGVPVAGDRRLTLYAADLARGPDGRMWILNDRTQAPSGWGFALENRTAVAQEMKGFLGELGVRRLAGFYRAYRMGLASIAPVGKQDPRVVVYTPGAYNPKYFEHAYLATYLGCNLVEGGDLTVRENRVWLKSLEGLQPVDMIILQLQDGLSDPLEFNGESQLGVPGLAECVRQGTVTVVNSLGAGVVENPGLMSFLPGIAKKLLGKPLLLPNAASWWCGQEKECKHVLENLEKLVIKPINPKHYANTVFGGALTAKERDEWRARILAHPAAYIGQERVSFSTSPAWTGSAIEPRHTVLRALVAWNGSGYSVMPGGLARSADDRESTTVSMSLRGLAKDTWILGGEIGEHSSVWLRAQQESVPLRVKGVVSSREGENMFWVGRYTERAEIIIHLLREILRRYDQRIEYVGEFSNPISMERLLLTLTVVSDTAPGFVGKDAEAVARRAQPTKELLALGLDAKKVGSLGWTIQAMTGAAFSVRDLWSHDSWRVLGGIDRRWSELCQREGVTMNVLLDELDDAFIWLRAMAGLASESMTRGASWHLLDAGRRVERGCMICSSMLEMLDGDVGEEESYELMETVLLILESQITYRRRYRTTPGMPPLLELLLFDEANPHGLIFQFLRIQESMKALPGGEEVLAESHAFNAALQWLVDSSADAGNVVDNWAGNLVACKKALGDFSNRLSVAYFSHAKGARSAYRLRSIHDEEEE